MMYDMNLVNGGPIVRDRFWYFGSVRNFQIDKKVTNSFWRFDPSGSVPNDWYFAAPRWFDPDPQKLDGTNGTERFPGIDENTISSGLLRLTYQASQNHKFSAHIDRVFKERYSNHDSNADIATAARHQGSPIYYTGSAKWTATLSSRLLLEAGYSTNVENWDQNDPPGGVNALGQGFSQDRPAGWLPCNATPCFENYGHPDQLSGMDEFNPTINPWYGLVMRHDQSTGYRDRYHWGREQWRVERFNYNIGLSYVTGSHNFKLGTNNSWGPYESYRTGNGDIERQMYRDGVPEFARVTNRPIISGIDYARDMGIFAQDTWTIDRLTLNLGVRWEQMIAHTYEAGPNVAPAARSTITQNSRFVAAQQFPSRRNLPNWKDFAPRLGLSYDVFGDASTAFKVSWGRYNAANTFTYAQWFNPVSYQRENRNWVDCASLDGRACLTQADLMGMGMAPGIAFGASTANDHTVGPDGTVWNGGTNGDGFAQDWEIGPPRRANFGGLASRPVEHPDGVERNWVSVLNVGIQRELFEGFSASFNWYRRDTYDSVLRVNRALGFDDFSGFLMDNPCANDPNRGFLSCNQSGGLVPAQISVFNLNPESDGIADDWVVQNTPTGADFSEVYNGFETGFNARLGNGSTIFGGWVVERNVYTLENGIECGTLADARDYCPPETYGGTPDHLYRNTGDGRFVDVSDTALAGGRFGPALGVATADFDGDGWIDIYVANDGVENLLWINRRDGTFRETGLLAGAALSGMGMTEASMGVDAGDFDNDGDEDLFLTPPERPGEQPLHQRRIGHVRGPQYRVRARGRQPRLHRVGDHLVRLRQRRLAGPAVGERHDHRAAGPFGGAVSLRSAEDAVPQPGRRPLRGRDGAGGRGLRAVGVGAGRGVRRHRQRRRRGRAGGERRRAGPVAGQPRGGAPALARAAARRQRGARHARGAGGGASRWFAGALAPGALGRQLRVGQRSAGARRPGGFRRPPDGDCSLAGRGRRGVARRRDRRLDDARRGGGRRRAARLVMACGPDMDGSRP